MSSLRPILWTAAIVAILLAGFTLRAGFSGDSPVASAGARTMTPAMSAGVPVEAAQPPLPHAPGTTAKATAAGEPPTHAQLLQRVEESISALDKSFDAEPLDAAWALREEGAIARFFDAASLGAKELPMPRQLVARCRSMSCRIGATYASEIEAEEATQRLAMHLGVALPYGAVMPRQLADGSIEVNAWYSAQPLRP